jgi:hypothetical protein
MFRNQPDGIGIAARIGQLSGVPIKWSLSMHTDEAQTRFFLAV